MLVASNMLMAYIAHKPGRIVGRSGRRNDKSAICLENTRSIDEYYGVRSFIVAQGRFGSTKKASRKGV